MRGLPLLLMGLAAAFLAGIAFAQPEGDPGIKLVNARMIQELRSGAARVGTSTSTTSDTTWIGHSVGYWNPATNPWSIYASGKMDVGYRPSVTTIANWDWDHFGVGETDSLQGWWPIRRVYALTGGLTLPDKSRPWFALDIGNQANYTLYSHSQSRTFGVVGVWHVDGGSLAPGPNPSASPTWTPNGGSGGAAWCGLRAHGDNTYTDPITGNAFNQTVLEYNGETATGSSTVTAKRFPGYGSQWDQILYRDIRVADGASLTVTFDYVAHMLTGRDVSAAGRTGWFDVDPTSITSPNFISSTDAGNTNAPIDSFMVYVGVPSNPTSYKRSDGTTTNTIYDLRRRWFSEVIAVDAPYKEILSVSGTVSGTAVSFPLANGVIQPMLDHMRNGGTGDGGGIIRVAFRSKTNRGFDDMDSGTTGTNSGTEGAVRIDNVTIASGPTTITTGFNAVSDINNTVEAPNSASPGPAVGQGYALGSWKSTGKPPPTYAHTHPIQAGGAFIGPGNFYSELTYRELCGPPDAPARSCNIDRIVISDGDHDRGEAAGGRIATAFTEVQDGIISPTINLKTPATGVNGMGLDTDGAFPTGNIEVWYDMYAGVYNLAFTGNAWTFGFQSYPATMGNGQKCWGELRLPTFQIFNPDPQCFTDGEGAIDNGLIASSQPWPDSLRVFMGHNQQCFRFAVSLGCSPTGGTYWDNIALAFEDNPGAPPGNSLGSIAVDIWRWYNDAFPRNETLGLPGTASFDSCAAILGTGINTAQNTNDMLRADVAGDTTLITAAIPSGSSIRMDMVFRILPGPGNYVVHGNRASGLRQVPTSVTPAVSGDGSFWGQYMTDNGTFGTQGGHSAANGADGSGWSAIAWNSARCDTAESNRFPVTGSGISSGRVVGQWASMYHELDPKFSTLGISKHKCFVIDTLGAATCGPGATCNVTCSTVPAWLSVPSIAARAGYDGNATTKEFTKILPDGLFTPGTHVQYFFRKSELAIPPVFVMAPDSNRISPQTGEANTDGHRWQQFGVLPDKWKALEYGGLGNACMLYVDLNDRRGNERSWVGIADSIGATAASKWGAHNGWHAAGGVSLAGSDQGTGVNAVYGKNAQPGTTWDMYGVKASESLTTSSGALGGRLAAAAGGYMAGKDAKMAPTPEMLRKYYGILMILTGDLNSRVLGQFVNRSQDDVSILENFMGQASGAYSPRGVFVEGDGFVQSETETGQSQPALSNHLLLLTNYFAVSLAPGGSYQAVSLNDNAMADLLTQPVVSPMWFGVQNTCLFSNDLYVLNTAVPGATVASYYQDYRYPASIYAPPSTSHPSYSLVDGWSIDHLLSWLGQGDTSRDRLFYFRDVFTNVFGSICAVSGNVVVDVPNNTSGRLINFMNLRNNPLSSGQATVHFGLAATDRVQVRVYDVSGRLVRNLADRTFTPRAEGYELTWDGTNDDGRRMARGVYFTQVKFVNSRFVEAKKLTVLR